MRLLALVLALTPVVAAAAPDPECLEKQKTDKKRICMDVTDVGGKYDPVVLVLPRSQDAKKDVNTTGDHLQQATERK